jgi:hypothetical protein
VGKKYIIMVKNIISAPVLSKVITVIIAAAVVGVHAQSNGGGDNGGGYDSSPRNRGYGFLMLEEPVSPRNAALGSAGTALGGYGFRYYNPVQPFFSPAKSSYASAEFGRMPGDVNRGGFETVALFPWWFSAISFFSSALDFQTADERGLGATASSGTTVGALGAGYMRGNAAAGVALSVMEDRIWVSSNYTAVALSFGLGYKLFDGRLGLGAAWVNAAAWSRGFGEDGSLWHDGRVPVFARAGAAWADTLRSFPYTVAADIVYMDEDGTFSAPVGLEVKVLPSVSLRIGKRLGWESEILSLGIGFNLDKLSFDAAFTPTVFVDDYEIKWSMGFTYSMGTGWRKRPSVVIEEPLHIKGTVSAEESGLTDEEPVSTEESGGANEEPVSTEESELTNGESVSTEKSATAEEKSVSPEESTPTGNTAPTE